MNRYGVLAAYIPAFGNIVGRMQYDLFHIYTVDAHTLFVLRNLRRFMVSEHSHEFPLCSAISHTIPKRELLFLAGLFHDIAKGRGGDHSLLGARDAWDFCKLHELSDYDARLVAWLVEKHLLMSAVAQRKDIEDPEVVQSFAAQVGDINRLNHLYVLTVADIRATNPKRWNGWKNMLLRSLYQHTRRALSRGLDTPEAQDDLVARNQAEARENLGEQGFADPAITRLWASLSFEYFLQSTPEEIAWQTASVLRKDDVSGPLVKLRPSSRGGATEIFVCAADRDNLFAHTAALLDQLCLNVVAARIETVEGTCTMNSFMVLEEDGSEVNDEQRVEEVVMTLRSGLAEPSSFDPTASRPLPRQLRHFDVPVEVEFLQEESGSRTEMRLRCGDRPGLLGRVGQVFAENGIRVHNAKITTLGAVAEDTFHLTDLHDRPLNAPACLHTLQNAIRERLET